MVQNGSQSGILALAEIMKKGGAGSGQRSGF
jgi:hypothetical protein